MMNNLFLIGFISFLLSAGGYTTASAFRLSEPLRIVTSVVFVLLLWFFAPSLPDQSTFADWIVFALMALFILIGGVVGCILAVLGFQKLEI